MKVAIVPIGNSRGIRLPKAVLEQVGLKNEAELSVENGRIVLGPLPARHHGWEEAFAANLGPQTDEDREWLDAPLADDGL
jgi:antitoxin MazE